MAALDAAPDAQRLIAAGNELEDRGDLDGAHALYLQAAALAPVSPRPLLNLGNVLDRQGRRDAAIAAVESAIALDPGFAPSYFNLGRLHLLAARMEPAEAAFRAALERRSDFADAAVCLASVLEATKRGDEAEAQLRAVIAVDPGHSGALHNLGLLLMEGERFDEAEAVLLRAVEQSPDPVSAWGAMGTLCTRTGRLREAESWHRRRLAEQPDSFEAAGSFLFALLPRDDLDPQRLFELHREVAAQLERGRPAPRRPVSSHARRIRVGYVSGDFRQHAIALFIEPVLAAHDRSQFEVFCYYNHLSEDAATRRLKSLAEHWRSVANLEDAAAAELIRSDRIDILIDLSGHTAHSRLASLALGCAPVQATWLGYLHSTGLRCVDFRICDNHTDPPGQTESLNSERLFRLPHSQWCYQPLHETGDGPASRRAASSPITFGAFNQFWKISDRCLDLWLAILRQLPGARLRVLGVPGGRTSHAMARRIAAAGIGAERIALLPRVNVRDYFGAIADVDIALDTTPYNGATTTLDVLWMGVPIVALDGDRSVARGAASILRTAGLPELVAATEAEYVDLNLRLARDHEWRESLRASLRERLRSSPLMDNARFTRDLEAGYRHMLAESRN